MNDLEKLKAYIDNANSIVFLTGAGVSTDSGIPDYRSKEGLYSDNPEFILSRAYRDENYEGFMHFLRQNFIFEDKEPNDIHKWIASLQKEKHIAIITQNVDTLHEQAGSDCVVHYHGDARKVTCKNCHKEFPFSHIKQNTYCECGGEFETDIVLYGDYISFDAWKEAYNYLHITDLIIVIGTSLSVYPFANLIMESANLMDIELKIALINKTDVNEDIKMFDIKLIGDGKEIIEKLK